MEILFVCTGNTCRSPMCEAYFNFLCKSGGAENLNSRSAGVFVSGTSGASGNACSILNRFDTKIKEHRSRQLTKEMLEKADLIVALTESHRIHIGRISPETLKKTSLLLDFSGNFGDDVGDPFGGTEDAYRDCFEEMKEALDNLFCKLKNQK